MKSQRLRNSVEEQVQAGLSPQQIAGVLKRSKAPQYCSHEAIYHYIYKERPDLIQHLRKKHKKRRKRDMKTSREFAILGKNLSQNEELYLMNTDIMKLILSVLPQKLPYLLC